MATATEEQLQSPELWYHSALAALAAGGRRVRPMPAPGAMGMFREAARGAGAAKQQRLLRGVRNAAVLSGARNACSMVPTTPCSVVPAMPAQWSQQRLLSGAGSVHFPATGTCYYQMMSIMGKF